MPDEDLAHAIEEIRTALRSLTEVRESPTHSIATRLNMIENRLTDHEARLRRVQEDALIGTWADFEETEKWKVWWGVWWRGTVAYGVFGVLVVLYVTATN